VKFTDLSTCKAEFCYVGEDVDSYFTKEAASDGGITDWSWDFGDGQKSTEQNPVHTYQNPGTYTVRLTVSGPGGSSNKNRHDYIHTTTPPAPVADFMGTPRTGDGPLTVQFFDQSSNVNSWLWDFGDGTTSTKQNPSHTYMYQNTGVFTVSLTVQGPSGSDTETKTNYIHLNMPSIYVNIGMSKSRVFRTWYTVTAVVGVTKGNPSGQPIDGATIEGTWDGGYGGTVSGTTDGNGRVSFRTEWLGSGSSVSFTVNKVIIGGEGQDFAGEISSSIRI